MRQLLLVILALVGATSCATPTSTEAEVRTTASALVNPSMLDTWKDELARHPQLFDEALMSDVRYLQAAIFIEGEARNVDCMAEAGFDYAPRAQSEFLVFAQMDPVPDLNNRVAEAAIAQLRRVAEPSSLESEPEESAEFYDQLNRCAGQLRVHPLYDETLWYSAVSTEATERTGADPRMIEAYEREARCEVVTFGESYSVLITELIDEIDQVEVKVASGELERTEGIRLLEGLADQEQVLAQQYEPCVLERLATETSVYNDYVHEITERESRQAELFVLELRDIIDSYGPIIDELVEAKPPR